MDIKSIIVQDTHGELAEDILRVNLDKPALSSWFTDVDRKSNRKILNLSANNVKYSSVPNIGESTYLTFLAYNGTSGYQNKLFSTVVDTAQGVFKVTDVPVMQYNPYNFTEIKDLDTINNVVIDIKMYNGQIDVLNYFEASIGTGVLNVGGRSAIVNSRIAYPVKIDTLPNVENRRVYYDGWYSYTQIIYRDLIDGAQVVPDVYYGKLGEVYKATVYGKYYMGSNGEGYIIRDSDGAVDPDAMILQTDYDYQDILFSLNATSDISPQGNSVFLHSQVLVTEELRYAILQEVIKASCKTITGCDFMDWQKLTLKRISASIMFDNGLFEKAQIIMESARTMCLGMEYDLTC